MSVNSGLKAWVRYDGNNQVVPGSLILNRVKPKVGKWKEYKDVSLCCPQTDCTPDYGAWKLVTGGEAGDGVVIVDQVERGGCSKYTFIGPNDNEDDGWVYLTRFFPTETCLEIDYEWTSFDDSGEGPPNYDYPVYWTSSTQPTGEPGDLTVRVNNTPEDGSWQITVPAGQWFSIGLYSEDSCCGRGFLQVEICEGECPEPTA